MYMHDAGYDMSNFEDVIKEFDKVIGLDKLGCIHINDSKMFVVQKGSSYKYVPI